MDMKLRFDTEVSPAHGLVALANAASFNNTHFNVPLTTFAQGWRDPANLEAELDFIAPPVQVPRRFSWRKAAATDDFMIDSDDERAAGADFKRLSFKGEIVDSKTINRGLTSWVDHDEVDDLESELQRRLAMLLRRMIRSDLSTAAALLLASATNADKTWNTEADPDADLLDMLELAGDSIGFNPNRLYMGTNAWAKRVKVFRAQNTPAAGVSAGYTPEQLAAWLNIERILVSRARYQSTATAKAKVVGAYIAAFYAEDGLSQEDPSHMKRFWTPCADGAKYRVYRREVTEKLTAITVERYVRTVATATTGLRKLTVS